MAVAAFLRSPLIDVHHGRSRAQAEKLGLDLAFPQKGSYGLEVRDYCLDFVCFGRVIMVAWWTSRSTSAAATIVPEDLAPLLEAAIGGDDDRAAFVTAGDEREERVGGLTLQGEG